MSGSWMGRALGWAWLAVLLMTSGRAVYAFASRVPEPADWREAWRDAPLSFWPSQWADFAWQPNLFGFRLPYLALLHGSGPLGYPALAWIAWSLALVCVALAYRLVVRTFPVRAGGGFVCAALATLALAPGFGADWLLVERFRVVLPTLWFLIALHILTGSGAVGLRLCAAGVAATLAACTHEGGALAWAALLPAVAALAARAGRSVGATVVGFALFGNVVTLLVWDQAFFGKGGLGVASVADPLGTLAFLMRAPASVLPPIVAGVPWVYEMAGALLWLALGVATLRGWVRRGDPAAAARLAPWLGLAWFGALAAFVLAHRHCPAQLPEQYVREYLWPVLFLPIGLAGVAGVLMPSPTGRGALLGLTLVLGAQAWVAGQQELEVKARLLRRAEVAMVLAELDGLIAALPVPVPERRDRDYLRSLGKLRDVAPLTAPALLALPRAAAVGSIDAAEGGVLHGEVVTDARFCCDAVVLVGQRGAERLVLGYCGPIVIAATGREPWRLELASTAGFLEGDRVGAFAFDVRRRAAAEVAGTFRFEAGRFVPEGGR